MTLNIDHTTMSDPIFVLMLGLCRRHTKAWSREKILPLTGKLPAWKQQYAINVINAQGKL